MNWRSGPQNMRVVARLRTASSAVLGNIAQPCFRKFKDWDDQIATERSPARGSAAPFYTGFGGWYTPITPLVEDRFRERLKTRELWGRRKSRVEKDRVIRNAFVKTGLVCCWKKDKVDRVSGCLSALRNSLRTTIAFV